jgi:NADH dehydrogenase
VSADTGRWVLRSLEKRRARIHLNTQLRSAENGHVVLSTGEEFGSELIVWTAGNAANPIIARHTDLPTDGRGLLRVRADLRVGTDTAPVPDAWAIGDNAAVPDLASKIPGATTVPNAQHAVRQAKRLAANILATIRGRGAKNCVHHNLGVVATLGLGQGVFQSGRVVIKGFAAWVMHRGYHVLAIPSWERKIRVLAVWFTADVFGRDVTKSAISNAAPNAGVRGVPPDPNIGRPARSRNTPATRSARKLLAELSAAQSSSMRSRIAARSSSAPTQSAATVWLSSAACPGNPASVSRCCTSR